MTATYNEAKDAIFGLFKTYWEANTPPLNNSTAIPVVWPGVDDKSSPDVNSPYAEIYLIHLPSEQRSLGEPGNRRFTRYGRVLVVVNWPLNDGIGLVSLANAAIIARDAFEGKKTTNGVWFRNSRIYEVGRQEKNGGTWYRYDVSIELEYDEIK